MKESPENKVTLEIALRVGETAQSLGTFATLAQVQFPGSTRG